jgi:hypothetical protein
MSHKVIVNNNKLIIDNKYFDEYLNNYNFNEKLYNISKKKNVIVFDHNISIINISNKQYRKLFNKN